MTKPVVDHLIVAAADLGVGVAWVAERLGVAPVAGGRHEGFGTRNALLGLGEQYLEVLALDPEQPGTTSSLTEVVAPCTVPRLVTLAVAKSPLADPLPMSRDLPDGTRLEWAVEFTATPLFFIDWMQTPRPSGLPDGGRLTALQVTTPDPAALAGVEGVVVREGEWRVDAEVDGRPLV